MDTIERNRYCAIRRLASITYYREQRDIPIVDRIATLVDFYKKQACYLSHEHLCLLRSIESGADLYDTDDQYRRIYGYTCEDDDRRLSLRDSGLALLFSIDSNCIPLSPPTAAVWSLPPVQMTLGI